MKRKHVIRSSAFVAVIAALLALLAGCDASLFTQFEQWDHVMTTSEFTEDADLGCLVYTYEDARFNAVDYFDMYEVTTSGVSDFDSLYEPSIGGGVFLYQPVYTDGSVTWLAHPGADAVLVGRTLRFYRVWK